jgi:agmatine/peptidylarginine deiminase
MSMRMPAEWAPHERTLMCWPAREEMWAERFVSAQADHAEVANAIAAFEPVLMAADPRFADTARRLCGENVEVVELASAPACSSASTAGARSSCPTTTTPALPRACSSCSASRAGTPPT